MKNKIYFISSMAIFGTIGGVVRYIDLASSVIALFRGLIGSLFLLAVMIISNQSLSREIIFKNLPVLFLSGFALACNWIFLFQAYKYTTIAIAVLSYYFAPVIVITAAPFILKENISYKTVICTLLAVLGMFLIIQNRASEGHYNHLPGIAFGLTAAMFYATLTLSNKFIRGLNGLETTMLQLSIATILLIPYVLVTEGFPLMQAEPVFIWRIVILGLFHTGLGFYLFFTGLKSLKGRSIAALSYIEPLMSVLVSILLFRENMTAIQAVGAVLLLGSTLANETDSFKST